MGRPRGMALMAIKRFTPPQFADADMQLLSAALSSTLDSILDSPLIGANLVSRVKLSVGANVVGHGLGRNYVSFFMGNPSVPMRLFFDKSPDPARFATIVSDAAGVADILFL